MSSGWPRWPSFTGRFSPFNRANTQAANVDQEDAYSYITNDDIAQINAKNSTSSSSPGRETDVLLLKHKNVAYRIHFPAYSIERNELSVGEIRATAAEKLDVDPARVKLLYKGRQLKDDGMSAREAMLRSNEVIMLVVGDAAPEVSTPGESSGSEDESEAVDGDTPNKPKRKRVRHKNKKKARKPAGRAEESSGTSTPQPASSHPLPPVPTTPMDKLNAIASKLEMELVPMCEQYIKSPPSDPTKRDFEYKRLSETILAQVLLKLDGVETEGDPDARQRRKDVVKSAQGWLNRLDAAVGK